MTPQAALNPGIGGVRILDERDRLLEVLRVIIGSRNNNNN